MEGLLQEMTSRGKTLETDESLRLPKRPIGTTNTFEDLGSSFAANSSQNALGHGTRRHAKVTASRSSVQELTDSSDDEINFFSQSSQVTDSENRHGSRARKGSSLKRSKVRVGGKKKKASNLATSTPASQPMSPLNATPKPLPLTSDVLKTLKFRKSKKDTPTNDTALASTSKGVLEASPFGETRESSSTSRQDTPASSRGSLGNLQTSVDSEYAGSRNAVRASGNIKNDKAISHKPKPRPVNLDQKNKRQDLALEVVPVNGDSKPRPKPRPLSKAKGLERGASCHNLMTRSTPLESDANDETTQSNNKTNRKPVSDMNLTRPSTVSEIDLTTTIKKPTFPFTTSQIPDVPSSPPRPPPPKNFPAMSPLSTSKRPCLPKSPSMPNLRYKLHSKSYSNGSPPPKLRAFPMLSLTREDSGGISASEGSDVNKSKPGKAKPKPKSRAKRMKAKVARDSSSESEDSSRPIPQPFPMSTQLLTSIEAKSPVASGSRRPRKRASQGSGRSPKQRKDKHEGDGDLALGSSLSGDGHDDWDEDLSVCIAVDPKLLCPFCDSLLPALPTPRLKKLITNALKKSYPDCRPSNPLGRKAPSAVFIAVCQRHRFESELLPEAERKGWPKSIDWDRLGSRVKGMRNELEGLVESVRCGTGVSMFWEEVKKELETKGSRAVASVHGQFAAFEKAQAGYYGELGYAIIHQTLYDLFPPTSFNPEFIAPLTSREFVQRVLVPEVAVRLIVEDKNLKSAERFEQAVSILRDSSSFGVAMFPDDTIENGKGGAVDMNELGVADLIVMERARKRRKELEEEDQREQEEEEIRKTEEEKRRRKEGKGKQKEVEVEELSKPKPRPKARFRTTSQGDFQSREPLRHEDSEGYMDIEQSSVPESSQEQVKPRKRKKSRPAGSQKGESEADEQKNLISDSDASENSKHSLSTPKSTRKSRRLMAARECDDHIEELPSPPSDEVEVITATPVSRRHKKRRDHHESGGEENTPKASKLGFGRPVLLESSQTGSQPLMLARQRRQRQTTSGNELTVAVSNLDNTAAMEVDEDDGGPWMKSMIATDASFSGSSEGASGARWDSEVTLVPISHQSRDVMIAKGHGIDPFQPSPRVPWEVLDNIVEFALLAAEADPFSALKSLCLVSSDLRYIALRHCMRDITPTNRTHWSGLFKLLEAHEECARIQGRAGGFAWVKSVYAHLSGRIYEY
ncbi:hypothetical protein AX17_006949 [Amanita inopinata Kibby_2008]|nr:hypothetical protein AX17_006949 [Amanita inopinata Kibby_2008]